MMSTRGVTDIKREKMREEAKKERAQKAKDANIVIKQEHKVGDFGFVSRKIDPDADNDPFSHSLKNRLIDYREILAAKEYHYYGIDNNVPGTPEVDIVNCEDPHKRTTQQQQPAPQTGLNQHHPPNRLNGFKTNHVVSTHNKPNQTNHKSSSTSNTCKKANDLVDHKIKPESQLKPKPTILAMPTSKKVTLTANDKMPKTHPSKIESILKEMTDTTPPLTDIQTPVKTQDTRFPFPQLPTAKDPTHLAAVQGKRSCPFKTEETLKNDLITTSDDDTDDEGENGERLPVVPEIRGGNLSASSSSSDDSSSNSSDSESSDSEGEAEKKHPIAGHPNTVGKKAMKRPAMSRQPTVSMTSSDTQGRLSVNAVHPGKKVHRGKVIMEEMCDKQVSPLNSASSREKKIEMDLSPIPEPHEHVKRTNHVPNGLNSSLDVHMHPDFSGEYFNALPLDPLFDEFGIFDHSHPSDIHNHNESLDSIAKIMNLEQIPSSFDSNLNISIPPSNLNYANETSNFIEMVDDATIGNGGKEEAMLYTAGYPDADLPTKEEMQEYNNSQLPVDLASDATAGINNKEHFNQMNVVMDTLSQFPAVPAVVPYLMDDRYPQKTAAKPAKKSEKHPDKPKRKDRTAPQENHNYKTPTPTQLHNKITPSKKDYENDWFMKILSPGKKQYDLPYVNPEKLKFVGSKEPPAPAPIKVVKPGPLKVQIPLEKIKRTLGNNKANDRVSTVKVCKPEAKISHLPGKSSKNDRNENVRKVKKKSEGKTLKAEKLQRHPSVGKDIETIKSLMAELSSKGTSDDDELIDVVTTSPLKRNIKPELTVSGKGIRNTPVSNSKMDLTSRLTPDSNSVSSHQGRTKHLDSNLTRMKRDMNQSNVRKRTRSSDTLEDHDQRSRDSNQRQSPFRSQCSKQIKSEPEARHENQDNNSVLDMDLDDEPIETNIIERPSDYSNQTSIPASQLFVRIDLSRLQRLPGTESSSMDAEEKPCCKQEELFVKEEIKEENTPQEPVWKPPPNIKIPRIAKNASSIGVAMKQVKNCTDAQDFSEQESTSSNASSCKPTKEKKTKRVTEGRGVKRKDWERTSKYANQNPNVCGMCGTLQKDTGRDPIRLGAYKTSYVEFLSMGTRNKRIADCHDPSERAPKYIDAVLKYIQYLVGLEITGKTTTKKGAEEYMCLTSQCIDLVGYVINQYGKKENNNIGTFDDRFVFLCLRLQSVLYFKLFGIKKDSASRYSKLLSEYFKVRRSPHRVSIKGSTGTPSPMSPSSSHNGSVASFGSVRSSASSGSYDKLNNGNMVSIPAETFERMQQYFAYTRFWLHGQRLWDEAEPISLKCQEFISIVSHRVGALTPQSSMLHLVDYISAGLEIIKDDQS